MTRKGAVGRSALTKRVSDERVLVEVMKMKARDLESRTPVEKVLSFSWCTSTSWAGSVPSLCRQTWWGLRVLSLVT